MKHLLGEKSCCYIMFVVIITLPQFNGTEFTIPIHDKQTQRVDQESQHLFPYEAQFAAPPIEVSIPEYRIAVVEFPPFIYKRGPLPSNLEGYCIDLLEALRVRLNFTYNLYESYFGDYPRVHENHTWTGAIRELMDNSADVLLAPTSVLQERELVVDFTIPFYDMVGNVILIRRPKTMSSLFQFLTVLEKEVWVAILGAYFLTSCLLSLLDRLSPFSYRNDRKKYINDEETQKFSLTESLWFCIISLTPQGGSEAPKNISGQIMLTGWWLFGFIIMASYTANLAAYLTVSSQNINTVKNLDDLFKQHKIKYAPINGSLQMTYFDRMAYVERLFQKKWEEMNLDDSLDSEERARLSVGDYPLSNRYNIMWEEIKRTGLPSDLTEGVQRVLNEDFALIGESTEIKYLTMINCDLMSIGEEFSKKPYALAVQKNSPLQRQFSKGILQLQNEGILESLKEIWWERNPERKECKQENADLDGISIKHNGGVFAVIIIGVGVAGLTLLFEYFFSLKPKPKPKIITVQSEVSLRILKKAQALKKTQRPRYYYY